MRQVSDSAPTFGADMEMLAARLLAEGDSVLSGCAPSKGTGDSVDIASGDISANGSVVNVSSQNVSIASRPASEVRFDLVTLDATGTVAVTTGGSRSAPDLPAGEILVAVVRVPPDSSNPIEVKDARPLAQIPFVDTALARTLDVTTSLALASIDTVTAENPFQIAHRTSDPPFTQTGGKLWYRTDTDAVKYESGGGQLELAKFDPSNCKNPIVRIAESDGTVKAFEAVDPNNVTPAYPHRIETASGVLGLHDTAKGTTEPSGDRAGTVIDDFEDNDLSEYHNTTSASIEGTTVYEGSYSLKMSGANDNWNEITTSQSGLNGYPQAGDTFRVRYRPESLSTGTGGEAQALFGFGIQGEPTGALPDNGYAVVARPGTGDIQIKKSSGGSSTNLSVVSYSGITSIEWYILEVQWGEGGGITFRFLYEDGTEVASATATDSEFIDGGVSFNSYSADGAYATWYDLAKIADTTSSTGVIDDFEDGDVSEYTGDTESFTTQTGTVYEGTYALESPHITNDGTGQSHGITSRSGLPRYPQAGDTFQFRAYLSSGDTSAQFFFGGSGSGSLFNSYYDVELRNSPNGNVFRLVSSDSGELAADAVTIPTGEWVRTEVDWGEGGSITATLYDSTGTQVSQISAVDSTFTGGGIGFRKYNGGLYSGTNTLYFDIAEITASGDATATGVVDDFEDGDIAEYSGKTSPFSVGTSNVKNGTYSLEAAPNDENFYDIVSNSGLPRYPSAGDTFRFWGRTGSASLTRFYWATQSEASNPNRYQIDLDDDNNNVVFFKITSSGATQVASVNATINSTSWYEVKVDWGGSGSFTITVLDNGGSQVAQLTPTDSTFSDGGIGWQVNNASGETIYFDYHRIV